MKTVTNSERNQRMIRSRLGLKALVLSGLVLGLMAFAASAAQAEPGALWIVNGTPIAKTSTLLPQLKIKEIEKESASLSFKTAGGTSVLILCTTAEFDEGGQLSKEGIVDLGRLEFTGCVTLLNEVAAPKCIPHTPGKAAGHILTEKAKGLIVLDKLASGEVDDFVLFIPDEGKKFAVIELGETCAIGETVNVEGELWIKDCLGNASFLKEAVTHLIEESLNGLTALGQPAKIIGSAVVELTGEKHKGLTWSGKPE
jgi:hypothetical protein